MIVSNTTAISNFLHLGQMEILKTIFKELHVPMAVYSEIEAYNIPISGTLGVLLKAKKMGIILSVKEHMDRLRTDHHFWINDAMYNKVLSLSDE